MPIIGDSDLVSRLEYLQGFIFQPMPIYLLDLQQGFQNSPYSDARDWIYATLALLNEEDRRLVPSLDNTKTCMQIYEAVTLQYCVQSLNIYIPRNCEFRKSTVGPSWISDWSKPSTSSLSSVCTFNQDARSWDFKGSKVSLWQFDGLYVTGTSMAEAYARIFVCNAFAESYDPSDERLSNLDTACRIVELMMADNKILEDELAIGSDRVKLLICSAHYISKKCLIRSTEGYIGIVPPFSLPGGEICVLLGSNAPMLLRPTEQGSF
ncbi:hypothetical protein F5Y19DRAFT_491328 [Xylariaceae sp. FL1651]|nr:hypothetical protein F5Y19DRAFT_491328 [Xylariaceae sp. FL1651]